VTRRKTGEAAARYEHHRTRARKDQAAQAASGQDIGEIPPVANPARRAACANNFRLFCETYLAVAFDRPWSDDHLKTIVKIEDAALKGGLFALAMPRGHGKTTLACAAIVWAVLYGHRRFVCLIASSTDRAIGLLESNKTVLETNELLAEDFPEVITPIKALGRTTNRQKGQKYHGVSTYIEWNADKIVLATIPGAVASAAIMSAAGMKGSDIRGQRHVTTKGKVIRPDLAIIDDPQTDDTAASLIECKKRLRLLGGAVLGMAGPGRKIAAVMPCTVIMPGDVADKILDRSTHPDWQGERFSMVYAFPTAEKMWDEYAQKRIESMRGGGKGEPATKFYEARRQTCGLLLSAERPCSKCPHRTGCMDAGARVSWPSLFDEDEISAIQHAMNLRLRNEEAFLSEYQNQPKVSEEEADLLSVAQVAARVNGHHRGAAPADCTRITAFIDVHKALLFWAVVGWSEKFTGYVLDYGTFPDQRRRQFAMSNARETLTRAFPGRSKEEAIRMGIEALATDLLARPWKRDDGTVMFIDRCHVDRGWEPKAVEAACRRLGRSSLWTSLGTGLGAGSKPISEFTPKPGQAIGHYWWVPPPRRGELRHVRADVNYWKSFLRDRLLVGLADDGALTFWGKKPVEHELIAEHLVRSEIPDTKTSKTYGRSVEEWTHRISKPDNHWLDCLVGCAVAANMLGLAVPGLFAAARTKKRRKRRKPVYL
jgi:hypothetical protein